MAASARAKIAQPAHAAPHRYATRRPDIPSLPKQRAAAATGMSTGPGIPAAITYLDGRRLQRAMAAGARQVRDRCAELDAINVFPVADHDTGTNLVFSLRALAAADPLSVPRDAGAWLRSSAELMLDNAQGWAGSVLAWFVHGAGAATRATRLGASDLAQVLGAGVAAGREGVDHAAAGTLIDVLEAVAAAAQQAAQAGERDLARILAAALGAARVALDGTRERCPPLRAAGVVDAGALAFVLLLEGMAALVANGTRASLRVPTGDRGADRPAAGQAARPASSEAAVVVVTDSAADLPQADIETLGIRVVPLRLNLDGRLFIDKIELAPREFFTRMRVPGSAIKTSQPSPGDFLRAHQLDGSRGREVVSIHVPAALSGTLNGARVSARHSAPGSVHVVDAGNVSVGQGLVVRYAAEAARAGLAAPAVIDAVARIIPRTRTVAVVSDLGFAVRGGRVGRGTQRVADAFRLAPVLASRPDGRVGVIGVLPGRRDLARRLARRLLRSLDRARTWRIAVGHCDDEAQAARLLELLAAGIPLLDHACLVDCGTVLGAHAGPGALVVGIQHYTPPAGGS